MAPGVAIQTGAALDTPPIARVGEHSDNADPDVRDGMVSVLASLLTRLVWFPVSARHCCPERVSLFGVDCWSSVS